MRCHRSRKVSHVVGALTSCRESKVRGILGDTTSASQQTDALYHVEDGTLSLFRYRNKVTGWFEKNPASLHGGILADVSL